MPTIIKLKNSVTATNAPNSLQQGEVAINITDKKVWVGNAATTPVQLLGDGGNASFTSIAFGAGTVSSPSITFKGDTNTGIYSPAADVIAFTDGGTESMRINASGNVGIGTTSPAGGFRLDIQDVTAKQRIESTTGTNEVQQRYVNTGGTLFVGIDSSAGSGFAANYGAHFWHTGNYPVLFGTNNTNRMTITGAGNVGINTNAPTVRLDVRSDGDVVMFNLQETTSGNNRRIRLSNAGAVNTIESTAGTGGTNLAFTVDGVEGMRIDGSRNVGIGETSPTNRLNVKDATNLSLTSAAAQFRIEGSGYSGFFALDATSFQIGQNSASRSLTFHSGTGMPERVRINASGNVGIGSTSPVSDARLTIGSPTTESYVFFQRTNASTFDAAIGNTGGNIVFKGNADSSTVAGLSDLMVVTAAGLFQFNSGYGSVATAYGCRAWVNFNGTGTPAISASGNVTSITDNGTGDYTINFTTAFPDANYSVSSTGPSIANTSGGYFVSQNSATAPTTSAYRINVQSTGGSMFDSALVQLSFFR